MLDAVAELGQHVAGHVLRSLGHEENADALGADQPHRLHHLLQERPGGVLEQQMRLIEEEHELRDVLIPYLGQVLVQLGKHPHHEGGEQLGSLGNTGQLQAGDDAGAVFGAP